MPESTAAGRYGLRKLTGDEAAAHRSRLQVVFRDAVRVAGPTRYSTPQVEAWAASADDTDAWVSRLAAGSTWVAVLPDDRERIVGLALMLPAGHVDLLYVDPAFHRRGIATGLLAAVEPDAVAAGIDALSADASLISHPVFVAAGYDVVEWEEVVHRGVTFPRAKMQKRL